MSGKLRAYPAYRDSGLPWLGAVPAHWEVRRAKYYLREVDERSVDGTEERLSVSHLTGVTPRREKNITMFEAESYVSHKLCHPGDVVVNTMWAWMGALGVSPHHGIVSPAYGVYRPLRTTDFEPAFLDYLLRTPDLVAEYVRRSTGIQTSRLRLYAHKFLDLALPCPPMEEQRATCDYLDAHGRLVQRFARTKRQVTAALDEYRLRAIVSLLSGSLVHETASRQPGTEWLGTVPAHWHISALRHRYSVKLGKMLDAKRITGEHLLPYLRNVDVQWDRINVADLPQMDVEPHEYAVYTLSPGDLLVCEGGEVGRAAFWRGELERCAYQKALHRVRVLDADRDNPRFLFYLLFAAAKLGVFLADGSENTIAHLTQEKLRAFRFPFPPKHEQDAIAARLDRHGAEIDRAAARVRSETRLVRAYQERVIVDGVLGRCDVRGRVPLALEAHEIDLGDTGDDPFGDEPLDEADDPLELEEVTSDAD